MKIGYTNEDLQEMLKAKAQYVQCERKLHPQIERVIETLLIAFGYPPKFRWWFEDAGERGVGTTYINQNKVYNLTITDVDNDQMDFGTSKYDYCSEFPNEFLTMSSQDIVDRVRAEIAADEQIKQEAAQLKTSLDAKGLAERQAAIAKLTAHERRLLGLD